MKPRIRRALDHEFLRFIVVGGLAAVVNLGSRWILSFEASYELAVAVAYLFGMATAYSLSRRYVFDPSGRSVRHEVWWFCVVNAVALVQVWVISVGLARLVFPAVGFDFHPEAVAHLIGVASPVITSYIGHKLVTFRPSDA